MDIYGAGSYEVNDEVWSLTQNILLYKHGNDPHVRLRDKIIDKLEQHVSKPFMEIQRLVGSAIFIL
jgi:hypothetical protein